ncbi:uncharacterized protein EV422DRAFT_513923 [Fimicolochytrium jonesii]|uniref:uncharacterized protein n=1 Tax=Fimicolochytrium jonesii TaxID=1396493 RepID=UPI0022FE8B7B|nr:uncharacterized protein EV422DRAFT_513923 [Fimicolochytrium jonesii]KAI8825710.1 hypothetical protein EV422DRAFT_513923 [Fimicolochytrium jonesii]
MSWSTTARGALKSAFALGGLRSYASGPAGAGAVPLPPPPGGSGGISFNTIVKVLAVPTVLTAGVYYWQQQNKAEGQALIKAKLDKKARENPVAALDGKSFLPFALKEVSDVNHNTKRFRFALPEGTTELGLPTASCVLTKFVDGKKPDGKPNVVVRPYTPVEDPADGYTGYFDMIIKKYPNGPMSTHIFNLKPGDTLDIKGPNPKFPYKANEFDHITLLAGGTGITPMLQLIQRITHNPEDKTKMTLVFANIAEEDILLKDYLDNLQKRHGDRFTVRYCLEKPPMGWRGDVGYINEKIITQVAAPPKQTATKEKIFICGPNQMLEALSGGKAPDYTQGKIGGVLKKLGYVEGDVYKF